MIACPYLHENTYRMSYLGGAIHRLRLKKIIATLRGLGPVPGETWADFGCSSGFIIETVMRDGGLSVRHAVGFDYSWELLKIAKARGIENASFEYRDMNAPPPYDSNTGSFGLVTCFETLEHVADYQVAFQHLVEAARPGGFLFVTVPNETGLPGLLKFWGRLLTRRNPYGDFFKGNGPWPYIRALLTGSEIERFRRPSAKGYGPHLGFDFRRLVSYVDQAYVASGKLALIEQSWTCLGMNVILLYKVGHGAQQETRPNTSPNASCFLKGGVD